VSSAPDPAEELTALQLAFIIIIYYYCYYLCPMIQQLLQQLEEDTGLSVGAAWIAGQDRSMWRTLRPSAGQAQQ